MHSTASSRNATRLSRIRRIPALAAASALALAGTIGGAAVAHADEPTSGDPVWVGDQRGYGGSGMHAVFLEEPDDPDNPGAVSYWAYCIEHDIIARSRADATLGTFSDYLGTNLVIDPTVQGKILWVLAHGYPAVSLADFGTASGVPGITESDAIEMTQYALWRFTDVGFDAGWVWTTDAAAPAYWYLVNGANAASGMTPADFVTTVSITGPAGAQLADSLVGPFTVATNQATVTVSTDPAVALVDAAGASIDPAAVVDGQQLYLDLRGSTSAGAATLTARAPGSSATGSVILVPTEGGDMTSDDHAQTMILVAASTTRTSAEATASWGAVAGGDTGDGDTDDGDTGEELAETGAVQPLTGATIATLGALLGAALLTASRRRRTDAGGAHRGR